jgi:hypothetical protein
VGPVQQAVVSFANEASLEQQSADEPRLVPYLVSYDRNGNPKQMASSCITMSVISEVGTHIVIEILSELYSIHWVLAMSQHGFSKILKH